LKQIYTDITSFAELYYLCQYGYRCCTAGV